MKFIELQTLEYGPMMVNLEEISMVNMVEIGSGVWLKNGVSFQSFAPYNELKKTIIKEAKK